MDTLTEDNTVTFIPHLYLQRQAWILDVIRKERPVSVLDIGCGEGSILACIINPASSLAIKEPKFDYLEDPYDIHIPRLAGLDIDKEGLAWAIKNATIPEEDSADIETPNDWSWIRRPPPRWEELTLDLWHGGLETFNPEFVYDPRNSTGYECIVSTEVIEHLPPQIFPFFAHNLLGKYRPRILAITTPNYSYNTRFRHDSDDSGGYPDPTRRTNRIFRHHDHKFEWTTEEFTEWCQKEANTHGYDVYISGLGRCREGGDDGLGFASLCAVFRINGRFPSISATPTIDPTLPTQHTLVAKTLLEANLASDSPVSRSEILIILKRLFQDSNRRELSIQDLWVHTDLSIACGGRVELIIDAVQIGGEGTDKWELIHRGEGRSEVILRWGAMEVEDVWEEEDESDVYESYELETFEDDDDESTRGAEAWPPFESQESSQWGVESGDNRQGWGGWGLNESSSRNSGGW